MPRPRHLAVMFAVVMTSNLAIWILLDYLLPPAGCSIGQALFGDVSRCGPPTGRTFLNGVLASAITVVALHLVLDAARRRRHRK